MLKKTAKKKSARAAIVFLGLLVATVFSFTPVAMDKASADDQVIAPTSVRLYKATKNTVTFKWNGSCEAGWQVAFKDTKSKSWKYAKKHASSKKYTVNPYKNRVYEFRVRPNITDSKWSYIVKAKANRGKIRNITKVKITTGNKLTAGKTYTLKSNAYVGKKKATKKNAYKPDWRKWSVSDKSIATVNGDKLKAKKAGTVTLKVRTISGFASKKTITIKKRDLTRVDASKLSPSTINKLLVKEVNKERKKAGAEPVKLNQELCKVAMIKAKDMYKEGEMSHYSKTYGGPSNLLKRFSSEFETYDSWGENIAYLMSGKHSVYSYDLPGNSVKTVMYGWMGSTGHKENILDKEWDIIGVAHYKEYWVQEFVKLKKNEEDDSNSGEVIDTTNMEPDEDGYIVIE